MCATAVFFQTAGSPADASLEFSNRNSVCQNSSLTAERCPIDSSRRVECRGPRSGHLYLRSRVEFKEVTAMRPGVVNVRNAIDRTPLRG
jgi:hypothetical protein